MKAQLQLGSSEWVHKEHADEARGLAEGLAGGSRKYSLVEFAMGTLEHRCH